jgi:CHAT domain-containing protein/Flp pilus assembly protein TadD
MLQHSEKTLLTRPQYSSLALLLLVGSLLSLGWTAEAPSTQFSHTVAAERAFAEGKQLSAEWKVGSLRQAIKKFQSARLHWRSVRNETEEIKTLQSMAEAYERLSDYQKALVYQKQALALSQAARDSMLEINSLNAVGFLYLSLGELEKAVLSSQQALRLSHTLSYSFGEALALSNLGEIHDIRGDLSKALEYFEQAMQLLQGGNHDAEQAHVLLNIGYAHADSGDERKALDAFNKALSLAQATGDLRTQARAYTVIGQVYSYSGEKQKALEFHGQALDIFRNMGNRYGEAVTLDGIAFVYQSLGEYQTAIETYNSAFELFQRVGNLEGSAFAIYYVGKIHIRLGNDQKGLECLQRGLSLIRRLGDRRGEAHMLRDLGGLYFHLANHGEALHFYLTALSLVRSSGDLREEGYVLNDMGQVHEALGAKQKAGEYYGQALALGQSTDDLSLQAAILHNLAHLERSAGDTAAALGNIEAAIRITEGVRTGVSSPDLRSSYVASNHQNYEIYIDLLMQMHKYHPSEGWDVQALQASERSRARSLIDMLVEGHIDIRQGVDSDLVERERSLQHLLDVKVERQVQLGNEHHEEKESAALAKEINDLTIEYDQVRAQIRSRSPRYAALTQPMPLSLEEIQHQVLDEETLLLEYALGDQRSYLWAVTPTSLTSYELPSGADIEKQAQRVRKRLVARQPRLEQPTRQRHLSITETDAQYWQQAASLSQMLLGPIGDVLGTKRLLIVTEGALQYLPFGALPVPRTEGKRSSIKERQDGTKIGERSFVNEAGDRPLLLEHEIVSLPSASVLAVLRRQNLKRETPPKAVFVFADPVFEKDDPRLRSASRHGVPAEASSTAASRERSSDLGDVGPLRDGLNVGRLPSTRLEGEAIMALASGEGKMAIGFNASRATATSPELSEYRIVHFATHGVVNNEHPELSGIILSMLDEQGHPQNGFLRLRDIYNLNLQVDLVVLSACDTGLGKEVKGEGLVGMVRGFLHAGAARVIASLWKVDDEATAELMKQFYQEMLQKDMAPAAALRQSQVAMWQQRRWRSPFYWGAFVLQGEWR